MAKFENPELAKKNISAYHPAVSLAPAEYIECMWRNYILMWSVQKKENKELEFHMFNYLPDPNIQIMI